ncbi:MAG: class I SAM-dependent methyltransferase [Bacteroidota bacterium]
MDWKAHWDQAAEAQDPYQQVARVGGKGPLGEQTLAETAARIASVLQLKPSDHLLDVCCGNGLLTQKLLPHCGQITGVDLSAAQIKLAQKNQQEKLQFLVADATNLEAQLSGPFDHIALYFSFQYLETEAQASACIEQMAKLLKPGGRILLGDVPEREKLGVFYPKQLDRWKYALKLRWGKSLMGRFWSLDEIEAMAIPLGLKVQRLEQPEHFPYAHYRADFLLEKLGE